MPIIAGKWVSKERAAAAREAAAIDAPAKRGRPRKVVAKQSAASKFFGKPAAPVKAPKGKSTDVPGAVAPSEQDDS